MANLWTLSVAWLRVRRPAAVELPELCALFAAEPVPLGLFTASPDVLGDSLLGAAARDTLSQEILHAPRQPPARPSSLWILPLLLPRNIIDRYDFRRFSERY